MGRGVKMPVRRVSVSLGDFRAVSPFHLAGLESCSVMAEVVWVHPEGRFYVAEWTNPRGAVLREGFME